MNEENQTDPEVSTTHSVRSSREEVAGFLSQTIVAAAKALDEAGASIAERINANLAIAQLVVLEQILIRLDGDGTVAD